MKIPVKSVALWLNAHCGAVVAAMAACGLLLRFREAATTYLNPDEAWQVLLAVSPQTHGVAALIRAAMDVSHPPVLIVALKVVEFFGRSEVTQRLIPVVAGTLFPVFVMLWVRRLAGCAAGICAAAVFAGPHRLERGGAKLHPGIAFHVHRFVAARRGTGPLQRVVPS